MNDEIFNMTRAWDKEKSESPTEIEPMTGVREVMGSIPVGDSDFSLSHARVMLNISSFTRCYVSCYFTRYFHLYMGIPINCYLVTTLAAQFCRLFQALLCRNFIPWLTARTESRETWTPAQNGRLDWVGGGGPDTPRPRVLRARVFFRERD